MFEQWMKDVDEIMWQTGCSVYDLPDCPFRDWYEDEMPADEAAEWAIKEET